MTKRAFDIALALALLVLLLPLQMLVAAAVWLSMGRPVLFVQRRAGRHGREFEMRKFRTMRTMNDPRGVPLPDEARVTRVGRLLRRTRLDELPELWHILIGDLSFVGPRPLPWTSIADSDLAARRQAVRPGLTGLAQVSGNTLLAPDEKFAIDILYVERCSAATDILVLVRTLGVVLFGERRDETLIGKALEYAYGTGRGGR